MSDFGVSAAVGSASAVRSRSSIARAVVTLAPEVAQGEAADPRADVFSLGALLHVMLIGPRFSPETSDEDVFSRVVTGSFDSSLFGPQAPPRDRRSDRARDPARSLTVGPRARPPSRTIWRRTALALGVGDGRVFLRHAMRAMFGEGTAGQRDRPSAPAGPRASAGQRSTIL